MRGRISIPLILSYVFDWIVLIALGAVATILGEIEPNKRPFSLADRDISFPFTEQEACPSWLLLVLVGPLPIGVIAIVTLIFVPGATVPKDTPRRLLWQRKLWELHVGWLGLLMSLSLAWFFTSGMKNMFGKPRPDLLSRCRPDLANAERYAVGGFALNNDAFKLYSGDICTQPDDHLRQDGFRSFPSGHSSASAAGLIYLSLFLASKFAVTIPFAATGPSTDHANMASAFPSRNAASRQNVFQDDSAEKMTNSQAYQNSQNQAIRRRAAAPPVYLLVAVIAPFCVAIWISASRWYDFRHHGFDILFGFSMGTISAIYSFRYYHLDLRQGAGWAWGPRSRSRAWWAGVGRLGYVGDGDDTPDNTKQLAQDPMMGTGYVSSTAAGPSTMMQRNGYPEYGHSAHDSESLQDVELTQLEAQSVHQRV
ncbi:phosphatidic acid phosphatase type 2/haloperoxidase [Stachybotrys elegans]|uniref:Phosphatidic acid phosphatase type 2/haloperoxidase n=1 Tax=Stachybotrys elegans TaxID=80388 RepID=A0A8K0T1D9_9HYPO|nr:phosphatidic acid phosphatase type 2/haloperoxidase [Stachybotrys elegans]